MASQAEGQGRGPWTCDLKIKSNFLSNNKIYPKSGLLPLLVSQNMSDIKIDCMSSEAQELISDMKLN